jgi:hypothetical protein
MWRDDRHATTFDGRPVEEALCGVLERYIGECLACAPNAPPGWWSDGVIRLEIKAASRDQFNLLGVTWIDSAGITPFEFDVELNPTDQDQLAKTIFRIGTLDDDGYPKLFDQYESRLLERRPQRNRDWAVAVELTPPPPT